MLRISEELKPADEAANATIAPTIGERPKAWNDIAPSGIRMTYTASEATEPVTPASASVKVNTLGPTFATIERTRALSRPECSATATPSITVRITPRGGKLVKFSTASVSMR